MKMPCLRSSVAWPGDPQQSLRSKATPRMSRFSVRCGAACHLGSTGFMTRRSRTQCSWSASSRWLPRYKGIFLSCGVVRRSWQWRQEAIPRRRGSCFISWTSWAFRAIPKTGSRRLMARTLQRRRVASRAGSVDPPLSRRVLSLRRASFLAMGSGFPLAPLRPLRMGRSRLHGARARRTASGMPNSLLSAAAVGAAAVRQARRLVGGRSQGLHTVC
mmetsp:Transcript_86069/g.248520  ORF Transcript_86069/g.248520 Transcript_86069/m.248520 type:complete len:216 (-) Transcript_86069:557-1204(-)